MQVPIALALGFDKPLPGLMDRKPRPLSQPVLSRAQWARLILIGALVALGTLYLETAYEPTSAAVAATMGFVVFSLFNIAIGLSSRSETETVFQVSNFADRRQLGMYGLSLLLTFLPTELGIPAAHPGPGLTGRRPMAVVYRLRHRADADLRGL